MTDFQFFLQKFLTLTKPRLGSIMITFSSIIRASQLS